MPHSRPAFSNYAGIQVINPQHQLQPYHPQIAADRAAHTASWIFKPRISNAAYQRHQKIRDVTPLKIRRLALELDSNFLIPYSYFGGR